MPRFFVPRAELGENFLVLRGENAAHARVLRLKNGDAVTVCDGEGEDAEEGFCDLMLDEDEYARMLESDTSAGCKYFRPDVGEYGIVRKQN